MIISKDLLGVKLFYFLQAFGHGCFSPFTPVLINQKGYNAQNVGFIYSILTILTMINKTVVAAVADYFRAHKAILLGGIMLMMLSFAGICYAPPLNNDTQRALIEKVGSKWPNVNESVVDNDSNTKDSLKIESSVFTRYEFYILFFFMLSEGIGGTSVNIMGETLCFSYLGSASSKYGEQRLWATIGWGVAAAMGGVLIDRYSKGLEQANFFPVLMMSSTFFILNFINVARLRFGLTQTQTGFGKLGAIFRNPTTILVLVCAGMKGLSTGMINTFKFLYMEEVAKDWDPSFSHMKSVEGLLIFIQCICSEAPVLFMSCYIIRRLGLHKTYILSFAAQSMRILLFAHVTNPWHFLPLGLFHGVTFGLCHANMMTYVGSIIVKGAEASTQAVFNVVFYVALGLGGSVGGALSSQIGYRQAFIIMGTANAIFTLLYAITSSIIPKPCPKKDDRITSNL